MLRANQTPGHRHSQYSRPRDLGQGWDSDPERLIWSKQAPLWCHAASPGPGFVQKGTSDALSWAHLFRIPWRRLPHASPAWRWAQAPWGRTVLISAGESPAPSHQRSALVSPSVRWSSPSPEILQHFCFFPDIPPWLSSPMCSIFSFVLSYSVISMAFLVGRGEWLCCLVGHFGPVKSSSRMYYCLIQGAAGSTLTLVSGLNSLTGLRVPRRTGLPGLLWPWFTTASPASGMQSFFRTRMQWAFTFLNASASRLWNASLSPCYWCLPSSYYFCNSGLYISLKSFLHASLSGTRAGLSWSTDLGLHCYILWK